jgi:hypothetical protein
MAQQFGANIKIGGESAGNVSKKIQKQRYFTKQNFFVKCLSGWFIAKLNKG